MDLKELFNEYNFSEAEKKFIGRAKTAYTSEMNQSRIVSEFILGKRIEKATKEITKSNKRLAESNKKHLIMDTHTYFCVSCCWCDSNYYSIYKIKLPKFNSKLKISMKITNIQQIQLLSHY